MKTNLERILKANHGLQKEVMKIAKISNFGIISAKRGKGSFKTNKKILLALIKLEVIEKGDYTPITLIQYE